MKNWFTKKHVQLHERLLRQKLNATSFKRGSLDFQSVKSVGLVYNAADPTHSETIRQFVHLLKKQDKEVKVLAYFPDKETHENCPYKHFSNKALDWVMRPTGFEVEQFIETPFDVLINLCLKDCIPLEYISALSKAGFRVGPVSEKLYCYDLMIDASDERMSSFIKQVEFFLNRMNNYEISTI
ncbi:MAG: hypothetical protein AAF990_07915 [Bacteroidota bacterium]